MPSPNATVINVNTLQNDEEGKFVLVASKEGDKLIARKRKVVIGELYGDQIEIKQGLERRRSTNNRRVPVYL